MKSIATAESAAKYTKWVLRDRKIEVDLNSASKVTTESATLSVVCISTLDVESLRKG